MQERQKWHRQVPRDVALMHRVIALSSSQHSTMQGSLLGSSVVLLSDKAPQSPCRLFRSAADCFATPEALVCTLGHQLVLGAQLP